jgi:hypothetical protein
MTPKLTVRKHNGDDSLSYAVFAVGNRVPIVTGLSRREAYSHKARYAERAAKRGRETF